MKDDIRTQRIVHYRCPKCGRDWPRSYDLGPGFKGHLTHPLWGDEEDGYCPGPLEEVDS